MRIITKTNESYLYYWSRMFTDSVTFVNGSNAGAVNAT